MISKKKQYIVAIGDGYLYVTDRAHWTEIRSNATRLTAREAMLIVKTLNYSCGMQNVQRIRLT